MPERKTIVHITHEAAGRMGGIGQVLQSLLTCKTYLDSVKRSIIIGPWFDRDADRDEMIGADGQLLYCSLHVHHDHPWRERFAKIEHDFGIKLLYAERRFYCRQSQLESVAEVVLIDVTDTAVHPVNALKRWLYDEFAVESDRYENNWDYEQYVRLAPAALAVLRAINAADPAQPTILAAHEYMGIPTALAGVLDPLGAFKTIFYAHEVAPIRRIVENHPGHDTMFYNILPWSSAKPYYLNEIFGAQEFFFKYALMRAACHCDNIVAVGDKAIEELAFLGPRFHQMPLDLAYNGLAGREIDLDEKLNARSLLRQYAQNLLGLSCDYVFTHVARLTFSKAIWRDMLILQHLDKHFRGTGQKAVYFILGTDAPARRPLDILRMERQWNWPVNHRCGGGDLTKNEAELYAAIETFNQQHGNIKIVLINQFGFSSTLCGQRVPEEMQLDHLRYGTDLEFGQSIYEPFGISALEPLPYGGVCVVSGISGCLGFARSLGGGNLPRNIIVADYTQLPDPLDDDLQQILAIGQDERDALEQRLSRRLAGEILDRLPTNDGEIETLMQSGWQLASRMSWDSVCAKYFLPAVNRAYRKRRPRHIA